jgi:PAS domain S-box-containing protein
MGGSISASGQPSPDLPLAEWLAGTESLSNGVVVVAPGRTIALVNRHVERQFGYSRSELLGQPVDLLLPDGVQSLLVALPDSGPKRAGSAGDLVARRRDGSVFSVEMSVNKVQTPRGTFVVSAIADISARSQLGAGDASAADTELDFDRLVAEVSLEFIDLPAAPPAEGVRRALGRIGAALGLDRCSCYRLTPDGTLTSPVVWGQEAIGEPETTTRAVERFPWSLARIRAGEVVVFSSLDEVPDPVDRDGFRAFGIKAGVVIPLPIAREILGVMGFEMTSGHRVWEPATVHRLQVVSGAFGTLFARRGNEDALAAVAETLAQSRPLPADSTDFRLEAQESWAPGVVVGQSQAVQRVLDQVRQVAATDSTVLLLGETGTGKELFATQIHEQSARGGKPMVRVNCSAIPSTLMESELFGREKGAFTGALARQIGRFELAERSTIFLDEVGELQPEVQIKLLRVLEERQIERLGSPRAIPVNVRIIAATNRNLEQRIVDGSFREDLFYRLNVFPIEVPPLRQRVEDIPLLVWRFVDEFARTLGKRIDAIPRENMAALQRYAWPGNIRELRNIVERAMILASGPRLTISLPAPPGGAARRSQKLVDVEKDHIRSVLESTGWRIRGASGAADRLGLRPTTLETRMAKLGLKRPKRQ